MPGAQAPRVFWGLARCTRRGAPSCAGRQRAARGCLLAAAMPGGTEGLLSGAVTEGLGALTSATPAVSEGLFYRTA